MPRFRFRLERILSVRRHQEEEERIKFGVATQKKLEAEMRLSEVRAKLEEAMAAKALMIASRPTIEDLVRAHEYHLALLRREDRSIAELEEAKRRLEEQRLRLIEARKKRRVLERLRERRYEEWRKDEENRSQNELDEIGLQTFIRREAAAGSAEGLKHGN